MKIMKYKKQLIIALHLLFWSISVNCWNILFNPGVESSAIIKGMQDYWPELMALNFIFFLYCLTPFIWMIKRTRKWLKILLTIIFLIPALYLCFEFLQPESHRDDISLFTDFFISGFMYSVVFHLTIAAAVYFNLHVLINKYLKVSRFGFYLLLVSTLTVLAAIANFALFNYGIDLVFPNFYFISYFKIWELVVIIGVYLVCTTIAFLVLQYASMLLANRNKAQNELSALKAQINPHFLFNNLNTIYSLASKNDKRTKEIILQLSDFLRYVLYDTASEYIPLEKEVEIIRAYVELQKARVNPDITLVRLAVEGDFANTRIAPLLLLPLAENCFKHGKGKNTGKIEIFIGLKGNLFIFRTENTIALREKNGETENGGIGIDNVEKRLNLIYPDRYSLRYSEKEGVFRLELQIEL
jgi:two-component system, LytTR family, sensor kinase